MGRWNRSAHPEIREMSRLSSAESRGRTTTESQSAQRGHREISNVGAGYQAGVGLQQLVLVSQAIKKETSVMPSVNSVPLWFFGLHKALCAVSSAEEHPGSRGPGCQPHAFPEEPSVQRLNVQFHGSQTKKAGLPAGFRVD